MVRSGIWLSMDYEWLGEPHNLQAEHKELFAVCRVAIDIVHSYSRSVVYQAMTSIIQVDVTMVTANEKYSLLKSTYISDYKLWTQNKEMP